MAAAAASRNCFMEKTLPSQTGLVVVRAPSPSRLMLQNQGRRKADGWHVAVPTSLAIALLSLLVVDPAPSYDPWSWLLWGREVAGGSLSTIDGPAFKPLPVA